MQPVHRLDAIEKIDGSLGELSIFHKTYGFYVHGVSIEAAILPSGWEARTVPVQDAVGTRGNTGHCLEAHDLAASKLVAYRDKDRAFVRTLLTEGLIDASTLLRRIATLPIEAERRERLGRWVEVTTAEIG